MQKTKSVWWQGVLWPATFCDWFCYLNNVLHLAPTYYMLNKLTLFPQAFVCWLLICSIHFRKNESFSTRPPLPLVFGARENLLQNSAKVLLAHEVCFSYYWTCLPMFVCIVLSITISIFLSLTVISTIFTTYETHIFGDRNTLTNYPPFHSWYNMPSLYRRFHISFASLDDHTADLHAFLFSVTLLSKSLPFLPLFFLAPFLIIPLSFIPWQFSAPHLHSVPLLFNSFFPVTDNSQP